MALIKPLTSQARTTGGCPNGRGGAARAIGGAVAGSAILGPAFFSLRKALSDPDHPDICDPLACVAA